MLLSRVKGPLLENRILALFFSSFLAYLRLFTALAAGVGGLLIEAVEGTSASAAKREKLKASLIQADLSCKPRRIRQNGRNLHT